MSKKRKPKASVSSTDKTSKSKPLPKKGVQPKTLTYTSLVSLMVLIAVVLLSGGTGVLDKDTKEEPSKENLASNQEPNADDLEGEDAPQKVVTRTETHTISVSLNLHTIPDKNEVEVVLKNTSTEKTAYKFSTTEVYTYKILDESNKIVKEGTFGKLKDATVTLLENEEYKAPFNYDTIYKELPQGYYNLEVTVNHKDLSGSKTSTTFTVNDFDTSVTAVRTETFVIRSVDYVENTLEGVLNGISLITFKFSDKLENDLKKFKVSQDVLRVTYLNDNGVYTLQAVSKANEPNKTPADVVEPPPTSNDTTKEKDEGKE